MKQTAVEWLLSSLDYNQNMLGIKEIIDQAKEMEKEQINDACYEGYYQEEIYDTTAYYDKKYKQQ